MKINDVIERMKKSLDTYQQLPTARSEVIKAKINELNTIIHYVNNTEKYIAMVENDLFPMTDKIIKLQEKNLSLERRLSFYTNEITVDGKKENRYYFDLSNLISNENGN
jgi:hypothetical protein